MSQTEGYRLSYFVTSEKKVDTLKMVMQSGVVQMSFTDLKEPNKFLQKIMRSTDNDGSFLHYNLEMIESKLLESRGKITRDNKIRELSK